MLYHDTSGTYEQDSAQAATGARDKLQRIIDKGRVGAARLIEHVQTSVPVDTVVPASDLSFFSKDHGINLMDAANDVQSFHDHAFNQLCGRAKFPVKYARELLAREEEWSTALVIENLQKNYDNDSKRYLLRVVDDQVRGFLSDRYRRLDSRPLLDSFCEAAQEIGLVPCEGQATDTKVWMKAMLPEVYEPVPNEPMAFGAIWHNSDFGNGTHSLEVFCLRLWCTNTAIANEGLKQVHLGGRLSDDISFSNKTYQLDTDTAASAIKDVVKSYLAPARIDAFQDVVRKNADTPVTMTQAHGLLSRALSKSEHERVRDTFEGPDTHNVPEGKTRWRLSNAVSWLSNTAEIAPERKLELEHLAGKVLVP